MMTLSPRVDVGGEERAVLAAQQRGGDRGDAAEHQTLGVDDQPVARQLARLWRIGLHSASFSKLDRHEPRRAQAGLSILRSLESERASSGAIRDAGTPCGEPSLRQPTSSHRAAMRHSGRRRHQIETRSVGRPARGRRRAHAKGVVELVNVAHDLVAAELGRRVRVDGEQALDSSVALLVPASSEPTRGRSAARR